MRCKWCRKEHGELRKYHHIDGKQYELCTDCIEDAKAGRCRICKKHIIKSCTIRGLCTDCIQLEAYRRPKIEDDAIQRLEDELNSDMSHGIPVTDEVINKWIVNSALGFTPDMLRTDMVLRQLWMMTMYRISGIEDTKIVEETKQDIEWILDNELDKITYKNTRIAVKGTEKFEEMMGGKEVAVNHGNVYFVLV